MNLWKICDTTEGKFSLDLCSSCMVEVAHVSSLDMKKFNNGYIVSMVGQGLEIIQIT